MVGYEKGGPSGSKQSLWRRRRQLFILGGITLIVTIALAIGLGVGLTHRDAHDPSSTSSSNPASTPPAPPVGNGTVISGVWQPVNGTTWQYQLANAVSGPPNGDFDVWDIDLFDNIASTISDIQNKGSKVICYFSAGSYEAWRPDKNNFTQEDLGNALDGWEGENWIDIRSPNVRQIMVRRLDLAVQKGCNGVDPDNVDGYNSDNGLGLTQQDTIDYMHFLADETHERNLSIGLKNALEVVPNVIDRMQWSVNEQCLEYNECDALTVFIRQHKPVFHVEYPKGEDDNNDDRVSSDIYSRICDSPSRDGFSTVIKNMNLDSFIESCPITVP